MATIKKEGRYYYIYYRIGRKQYHQSLKTVSKKQAEMLRIKLESDIASGLFNLEDWQPAKQKTLLEFIPEALSYSQTNKAPATVTREKRVLNDFATFIKNMPLRTITPRKVEVYKNHLIDCGISPHGVNIQLHHLSSVFSLAVKYKYIQSNPFKSVPKVKTEKKVPVYLTRDEAEKLLSTLEGHFLWPWVFIALSTDARISEISVLQWTNIDWPGRQLTLSGKGSKQRVVPIPDRLYDYLKNNQKESGPVIPTGTLNIHSVSSEFRRRANAAGFNHIKFHNLRDTYASWLVQNGIGLKVIQEILGHQDIKTTLIYAHPAPDNFKEAATVISRIL